jgi:uncharacterized peroxidase-related enzyme
MAFIEPTAPDQTTGDARSMLERQQDHYGFVPNYAKVFSDRPDIMKLWADLQAGIRTHIDPRRFELVTFAAALELGSSYCSLAHARVLERKFLSMDELRQLAACDYSSVSDAEAAMMTLARKVAADSSRVTADDVDRLRRAGLDESEIFDVVSVAAARCFFAKLVDALGAQPDPSFFEMDVDLRAQLTVGRPITSEGVVEMKVSSDTR